MATKKTVSKTSTKKAPAKAASKTATKTATKKPAAKKSTAPAPAPAPQPTQVAPAPTPILSNTEHCSNCNQEAYFEAGTDKFCAACGSVNSFVPNAPVTVMYDAMPTPPAPAPVAPEPQQTAPAPAPVSDVQVTFGTGEAPSTVSFNEPVAGPSSMISIGKDTTKKSAFDFSDQVAGSVGQGTSIQAMYDEFQKRIYLFDVSGSMADGMPLGEVTKMFKWPPELIQKFRDAIRADKDFAALAVPPAGTSSGVGTLPDVDDEDVDEDFEDEPDGLDAMAQLIMKLMGAPTHPADLPEDKLKELIIDRRWNDKYKIDLIPVKSHISAYQPGCASKIEVVKQESKKFLENHFNKYPNSDVIVFEFDHEARCRMKSVGKHSVIEAIDRLSPAGGTNIYNAWLRAMQEITKKPSQLNSHHIILVSDGLDDGACEIEKHIQEMKDKNVVFDFIFIEGLSNDPYSNSTLERVGPSLGRVCKGTGGEFVRVRAQADFEKKFLAASTRLCLPAGVK